jgi:hypothetical protein
MGLYLKNTMITFEIGRYDKVVFEMSGPTFHLTWRIKATFATSVLFKSIQFPIKLLFFFKYQYINYHALPSIRFDLDNLV